MARRRHRLVPSGTSEAIYRGETTERGLYLGLEDWDMVCRWGGHNQVRSLLKSDAVDLPQGACFVRRY